MDNHSIHARHEVWLLNHEDVFSHYTPTSVSWLNMVEIWLGILERKSLPGPVNAKCNNKLESFKNISQAMGA